MAHDPRQLRPTELCRLLNSTPLGEVIKQRQMQEHRVQAGLRIGTHKHVDLLRYVAWLVQLRHARAATSPAVAPGLDLDQLALDVALSVNQDGEQRLSAKQEALLAAMLTEATCAAAAHKVGVSRMTAHRWLKTKPFQERYRRARQQLVNTAIGRLQLGSGLAVDALMSIVVQSRRDSDRVRAAVVILDHAYRGLTDADLLTPMPDTEAVKAPVGTADVVTLLGRQLRQLDQSSLTTTEKSRLTATLTDALLRAIGVEVLDKRLEALQSVLLHRKKNT